MRGEAFDAGEEPGKTDRLAPNVGFGQSGQAVGRICVGPEADLHERFVAADVGNQQHLALLGSPGPALVRTIPRPRSTGP